MKHRTFKRFLTGLLTAAMVVTSLYVPGQTVSAAEVAKATEAAEELGNELRLWYDEPTSEGQNILSAGANYDSVSNYWQQQTLPIGNGDMGANIYGEIHSEHLTFNEKTLWTGGPSSSRADYLGGNITGNGAYGETMAEVQRLFMAGERDAAVSLCNKLVGTNNGYGAYQPWGDIYFDYADVTATSAADVENYVRDLDLKTATANVSFTEDGTDYIREYFISHDDNVLVARLTAEGAKKLNLDVRFTSKQQGTTVAEGNTLKLCGAVPDNQLKYASYLTVVAEDGTVTANGDKLTVAGASEIVVYLSAATDYANVFVNPNDENDIYYYRTGETDEQLATRVKADVDAAIEKGYTAIKEDHIEDYQELFNRVSLDLGQTVSDKTTDQLLAAYKNKTASEGEQRQLENMLFQYGRYLTIGSSREDSQLPSNLQGVWNCLNNPPWASDYHMNVNLQMNYWPTYSTNLAECATPLVNYVDSLREPGRITAAVYAGVMSEENEAALAAATTTEAQMAVLKDIAADETNGFTAHTQNTPFGWTCPGWAFSWGWSPAAVPWIIQNCWEYYEYTGDVEYMREYLYPMLKEEAIFYDKALVDVDGKLVSIPSYSPEHGPYTAGNTYEQSLVWQLYEDAAIAAGVLGVDAELAAQWKENQADLKGPIEIGESGQLKEWYEETTIDSMNSQGADAAGHRHLSHMLGLFPGDLVQQKEEWIEAARVSMEYRTDNSTGWGMGQRINTWARLGDGNKAHELIQNLFKGGIYPNLWDAHSPFQIDGNFGMTSGVAEMLMQSNMGYINLLPALPDVWAEGSVDGLIARGNFEIDMDWANGLLTDVEITSKNGGTATVKYAQVAQATVLDSKGNEVEVTVDGKDMVSFETTKGETYTLTDLVSETAPENITATRTDAETADVTWDAKEGFTYNVYRQVEGGEVQKIASDLTETEYVDATAYEELGNIYYYVSAVKDGVESVLSKKVKLEKAVVTIATAGMVDDRNAMVQYSGGWGDWNEAVNYAGTIKFLDNPTGTETATLKFYGTGIEVWTCTNADRGQLEITIDGGEPTIVDTYSASTGRQTVIFTKDDLELGEHTIVVRATGTKTNGSRAKVELDAFKVLDSSVISVEAVEVSSVSGITTIAAKNSSLQLQAAIAPENAINKEVVWSSSDESIATVDENGLVTVAEKPGKVTITASVAALPGDTVNVLTGSVELSVQFYGDALEVEETIVDDGKRGEAKNPEITWTGTWGKWDGEDQHNQGTKSESPHGSDGHSFEYTFTGTGVEIYFERGTDRGDVEVFIDGESQGVYSTNGALKEKYMAFAKNDLELGEHTVKCVTKSHNGSTKVSFDFFKILKVISKVEIDRAALQTAISQCDTLVESYYDAAKWEALEAALATAVSLMNDTEATQDAIDAAATALTEAYNALGEPTIPVPVVGDATGKLLLAESTMMMLKWDMVEKADSYKLVKVEGTTETVVAEAVTATLYKVEGLTADTAYTFKVYAVNGGGQSAEAIVITGKTTAAETTDKPETPDKPDEPEKPVVADKKALASAITAAEALKEADYTADSYAAMKTALDAAKAVNAKEDATQKEVDDAKAALEAAVAGLKKAEAEKPVVADKKALASAITAAEALKAADYTAESYAAVQTALTAAKTVNGKAEATQAEVDAATTALNTAVAKLVKATTPEPTPEKKPLEKGKKFTVKGVTYKVTKSDAKKGEVAYVKTTSKAKTIIVPKTVKKDGFTYKVTSIEKSAFKNNKKVTKITLGSNVTTIGASAFQGCTALTKVTLGNNVTTINAKAFYGCAKITNITIPKNVKKIGASLFANCKKLKKITIKSTKLTKNGVAKGAFKGLGKNTKIVVPSKKVAQYKSLFKSKGLSTKVRVTK